MSSTFPFRYSSYLSSLGFGPGPDFPPLALVSPFGAGFARSSCVHLLRSYPILCCASHLRKYILLFLYCSACYCSSFPLVSYCVPCASVFGCSIISHIVVLELRKGQGYTASRAAEVVWPTPSLLLHLISLLLNGVVFFHQQSVSLHLGTFHSCSALAHERLSILEDFKADGEFQFVSGAIANGGSSSSSESAW